MSPFESSRWEEHFATGFKKLSAQEIYLKKPSMSIPNDSNILGTLPICLFCFLPVRLSILGNRTHDLSISRSVQSPGYSPATDSLVVFFFHNSGAVVTSRHPTCWQWVQHGVTEGSSRSARETSDPFCFRRGRWAAVVTSDWTHANNRTVMNDAVAENLNSSLTASERQKREEVWCRELQDILHWEA